MKSGVDWVTGKQLLLQVNPWFSNLGVRQNHLESWLKYKSLGFAPRVSDVIILGWGELRIGISHRLPGDVTATALGISL